MSCRSMREILHRDAASLDEAQRLQLDDHLAACTNCRGDRERLRLVREVGTALPVPPAGDRMYSRAIARAFIEGSPKPAPAPRRFWLAPLAIGALAAAATIGYLVTRPAPKQQPVAVSPKPSPQQVAEFRATFRTQGAAHAAPGTIDFSLDGPTQWSNGDRRLVLLQGKVEIDSQTDQVATIVTDGFEVEIANATVTIDGAGVHVHRGTARVVDRSANQLAQLGAGSAWQPEIEIDEPMVLQRKQHKADLLTQAHAQFAASDYEAAERTTLELLNTHLSRSEEAEARMFLADLSKAAGQLDVAGERYQAVASKFGELPVAESALYAAARVEARRGREDAAGALFKTYLARYPNGRYAEDIRRSHR